MNSPSDAEYQHCFESTHRQFVDNAGDEDTAWLMRERFNARQEGREEIEAKYAPLVAAAQASLHECSEANEAALDAALQELGK